jgi:hypothetical protein
MAFELWDYAAHTLPTRFHIEHNSTSTEPFSREEWSNDDRSVCCNVVIDSTRPAMSSLQPFSARSVRSFVSTTKSSTPKENWGSSMSQANLCHKPTVLILLAKRYASTNPTTDHPAFARPPLVFSFKAEVAVPLLDPTIVGASLTEVPAGQKDHSIASFSREGIVEDICVRLMMGEVRSMFDVCPGRED